MRIFDISQEVFSCQVYPGDRGPERIREADMAQGSSYNLTSFSMCAHNGTHIDAPLHFLHDGEGVEQIPLEKTVGWCYVVRQERDLEEEDAERILRAAKAACPDGAKRILIRGAGVVTEPAARVFAEAGVWLVGVESQSVGPEDTPMAVHKALLQAKTVLLEGLRLAQVPPGVYFLSSAPLCLQGSDGAPCRAILLEMQPKKGENQ